MTGQERDYEAILSRVLHTTTDQFEPVGDGLTKIRARLSEPWLTRQWWLLRNEFMMLRWLVVVRCESFFSRIRSHSDVTDLAPDASAGQQADGAPPLRSLLSIATPARGKQRRRSAGPAMAWFRPALAVAGAVVLVVAGVFALGSIRTVVGLDANNGINGSTTDQQNPNGGANGSGTHLSGSGSASQGSSRAASPGSSGGHSNAVPSSTPCPATSPPPLNSPSPAASSTSPPPSSPPPSSPPPSSPPPTSQAPLTGAVPSQTQEPIGTTALVEPIGTTALAETCEQTPGAPSPSPSGA